MTRSSSPPTFVDPTRQSSLRDKLRALGDGSYGTYPFANERLTRSELELLLTWQREQNDRTSSPQALDLRGADLSGIDLSGLNLASLRGGLTAQEGKGLTDAQRQAAALNLEGANLRGCCLRDAHLFNARMNGALLQDATLTNATLRWGHLEGANLRDAVLDGADLRGCKLDGETKVTMLGAQKGVYLAGLGWGETDLSHIDWEHTPRMLDEDEEALSSLSGVRAALRANRQLALALSAQGLPEEAVRYAYRSHQLQRRLYRTQRRWGRYGFSAFLAAFAGYGYKPIRSFLVYVVAIVLFATGYHLFSRSLDWWEALVVSMTAFHGRGFFPGTFSPGDPISAVSALEALVGLIIEVTFTATLVQRLFH